MNRLESDNEFPKINSYNVRIFLLLAFISIFILFIIIRMFNLQILNHNYYLTQAAMQRGGDNIIAAKRGEIYFTQTGSNQGVLAATNINKNLVFAIAREMSD